jgi:CTD small phosphatase-like protein 2
MNKGLPLTSEEMINNNMNFIIRNIHIIINNMKYSQKYNQILNILDKINKIPLEDIKSFFRNSILRINIFNSSLLSSLILKNNNINQQKRIIYPYLNNINQKIYSLVISLDETLIHFKSNNISNNKGVMQLRPGLFQFFQKVKSSYEIIIFSSGNKKYSDAMLDAIDEKRNMFDYRLYQEHCMIIDNDFVKDLSKIGRNIDKIIIVDNIAQNYRLQKENGINIKAFWGEDVNDNALEELGKILINIAKDGGDVRIGLEKYRDEIVKKVTSNISKSNY